MEQISAMRAANDAHLKSLKEAHDKEIASYRSYVSFLEKRIATQSTANHPIRQHLTIDTSHLPNKNPSLLSSEASATNSMQSFEMTLENQKRASSEAAAEAQKLRRERDHLKDSSERNERRVSQLRDIVRKAKDNEIALKNAVAGLEASLLSANNERLDVLEGFHEACEQVRILGKERDEFRNRLYYVDPSWKETTGVHRTPHSRSEPEELMQRSTSLRRDTLLQQLDEVRQTLSERNIQIEGLERQMAKGQPVDNETGDHTMTAIEEKLKDSQQKLASAQADRDRYDSLLHTELRRQSRIAAQKAHTTTPKIEIEALNAMRERLNVLKETSVRSGNYSSGEDARALALERELEHCFREIVMYKLDIKGYKKDLKAANAELDTLRLQHSQQRKTQSDGTASKADDRRATPNTGKAEAIDLQDQSSGLGITMPPLPTTPQRTIGSATASALLSTSNTPQPPSSALSPPHRPKTPLGVHKKLPKPPPQSRTPSPYLAYSRPRSEVQRQETMRSLSESIISSYAKRSTPEQGGHNTTSPPRGRSSDPPRMSIKSGENDEAISAKAIPMAKFTPRMLRTSAKAVGTAAI